MFRAAAAASSADRAGARDLHVLGAVVRGHLVFGARHEVRGVRREEDRQR